MIFSGEEEGNEHNNLYHINVFGQQTVNAVLQFVPSEVIFLNQYYFVVVLSRYFIKKVMNLFFSLFTFEI